MRRLATPLVLLISIGCGGDDDGDVGITTIDAGVDAPTVPIDAAPDAAQAPFLGNSCPETQCPSNTDCLSLMANAPGYCSIPCGTSAALGVRPEADDPACAAVFDQASGTPICGMPTDLGPPVQWYCVIDCSADDQCPGDLTCQDYGAPGVNLGRYCLR